MSPLAAVTCSVTAKGGRESMSGAFRELDELILLNVTLQFPDVVGWLFVLLKREECFLKHRSPLFLYVMSDKCNKHINSSTYESILVDA